MSTDQEILNNIFRLGKYYNPAHKHYDENTDVVCDKCQRHGIDVSIGWKNYDLCMSCVDYMSKSPIVPKVNKPNELMLDYGEEPNIIILGGKECLIYMMQSQFNSKIKPGSVKATMMQRQFRAGTKKSHKKTKHGL